MSKRPRRWRGLRAVAKRIPLARRAYRAHLRKKVRRERKRVIVYVDGFNLYRNALQSIPDTKWLDPVVLCEKLMSSFDISLVRYFTAEVRALMGHDPRGPSRQAAYLRVLEDRARVVVHRGKFNTTKRRMPKHPIVLLPDGKPETVLVRKVEEKQSDVNLAAAMIRDAMLNRADVYVLLSNDSDFAGLLKQMSEMGKTFGIISPTEGVSGELLSTGPRYVRRVRPGVLRVSQFPDTVRVGRSTITRPATWK